MFSVGNLSEKGIAFFADREFKSEIIQNSNVRAKSGESVIFYIGARHFYNHSQRIGKIFILKEEYPFFLLDLICSHDGVNFRSFDGINTLDLNVEFDSYRFVKNILLNNTNTEFFRVLELISMGITDSEKVYKLCVKRNTLTEAKCDDFNSEKVFFPVGGFDSYRDYNFYEDFYKKGTEDNGLPSLWNQYWDSRKIYSIKLRKYLKYGFNKHIEYSPYANRCYNFINNIYPEDTEMLNYRWHYGGYSVTPYESRVKRTTTYSMLKRWYQCSGIKNRMPLVKRLTSNSDWPFYLSSSSELDSNTYCVFDRVQSTIPGEHELVFENTTYGHIEIEFPEPIAVRSFRIRIGKHQYSAQDRPIHLELLGKNDGNWNLIWNTYSDIVPRDGNYKYVDFSNNEEYRYYKFVWYGNAGGRNVRVSDFQLFWGTNKEYYYYQYDADEKTVGYFTNIAKTDTWANLKKDEQILIDLLGPPYCIKRLEHPSRCIRYAYGGVVSQSSKLPTDIIEDEEGELPLNSFLAIRDNGFGKTANIQFLTGYTSKGNDINDVLALTPNGDDAFFSYMYGGGKIIGRTVYNNGEGNEYRYGKSFSDFLSEQGWSIDDFMYVYKEHIDRFQAGLKNSLLYDGEINPRDFCEFYDVNHRSPFDGIEVYIPIIPTMKYFNKLNEEGNNGGFIKVVKSKAVYDQSGNVVVEHVEDIKIINSRFTIPLDKDEFVSKVLVYGGVRIILSDYMRLKISLNVSQEIGNEEYLKFRISTSDFTYMSEREFNYVV